MYIVLDVVPRPFAVLLNQLVSEVLAFSQLFHSHEFSAEFDSLHQNATCNEGHFRRHRMFPQTFVQYMVQDSGWRRSFRITTSVLEGKYTNSHRQVVDNWMTTSIATSTVCRYGTYNKVLGQQKNAWWELKLQFENHGVLILEFIFIELERVPTVEEHLRLATKIERKCWQPQQSTEYCF